ncbi:hypothetical protein H6B07_17640 [Mediterraneibacter glycyrrhizinilyticus]|nr:hypothetical protein [Mediterraneibacter glycyrrhizinilyticus]MBM6804432.1 hypothetical protein [Mediterraneibacter glycyrrhizinilyticus]
MISRDELLRMKNMTFDDINPDDIMDIDDIHIDVTLSKSERIKQILESGKNPYFLKSGNIIIKIGFADTTRTIEDALESLVSLESKSGTEYGNGRNGGERFSIKI